MNTFLVRIAVISVAVLAGVPRDTAGQHIRGRVLESESLHPVAGATVSLLDSMMGVRSRQSADSEGRFSFDGVSQGTWLLQAQAGGRFSSISAPVEPGFPGDTLLLIVPSIVYELGGTCTARSRSLTVLAGIVYDERTGVPLPGAHVTAGWAGSPGTLAATTDRAGRYRFCDVPTGQPVLLRATALGRTSAVTVEAPDANLARADLGLDLDIGGSALTVLALHTLSADTKGAEVSGRILDMTSRQPLRDVLVRAAGGGATAVSADDGTFRLTGLEQGDVVLEVEHVAFGTHRELIGVQSGTRTDVELLLAERPLALDALEVEGRSAMRASARTSPVRFDGFSGANLAAAESRGDRVIGLVRTLPALHVMQGMFTTRYGVTNGVCLTTARRMGTLRDAGLGTPNAPWCDPIPVFVDDVPVADGIAFLSSLNVTDFESIQLLHPTDAHIRYGLAAGAAGGALVLWTRGRGPFVSQSRNVPPR